MQQRFDIAGIGVSPVTFRHLYGRALDRACSRGSGGAEKNAEYTDEEEK
ncbi:MAG: hypothetical protein H7X91_09205 [Burkholderiales bacterium]|nr:hypothetical protein [Burkholderiales bacterium]